jgi:hypothetical protein
MADGAASRRRPVAGVALAALLLLVAPRAAVAAAPRAALEIDTGDGPAAGAVPEIREMLAARLGQEGFEVVPVDAAPDVVVTLSLRSPDCLVRAALPSGSVVRGVPACGAGTADERLELVQKATELVRRAYRRETVAVAPRPAAPAQPDALVVTARAQPPAAPSDRELSIGAAMRLHASQIDPVARVGALVHRRGAWGLRLASGLSRAERDGVTVNEWDLLVGFGRFFEGARTRFGVTAFAGPLAHHYAEEGASGTQFDVVAQLEVAATARLSRHLGFDLRLAPGASRVRYLHLAGNDLVWEGSWWRVDLGIGLVFF